MAAVAGEAEAGEADLEETASLARDRQLVKATAVAEDSELPLEL